MLFCHITTQLAADPHPRLLLEKGGRGFPYLVFMNASGGVLDRTRPTVRGYALKDFEDSAARAKATRNRLKTLDERSQNGDREALKESFKLRLEGNHLSFAEARSQFSQLELDPEEKLTLRGSIANLGVSEVTTDIDGRESRRQAAATIAKMFREGWIPSSDSEAQAFWALAIEHAEENEDIPLLEKALAGVEDRFGERAKTFLDSKRQVLEQLKVDRRALEDS